jgi:hypothetical protein
MESTKQIKSKLKKMNEIENLKNQLKSRITSSEQKKDSNNILLNNYKNFVPKLKPKKIHLVPSKLRLNEKGFKDFKTNKTNKTLILNHNYCISCPNSEEEGSDTYFSSQEIINRKKRHYIELFRKKLTNIQIKNLARIKPKSLVKSNKKIYIKNKLFADELSDDDNSLERKEGNFLPDVQNEFDQTQLKNNDNKVNYYRFNSCTILDILKSKYSLNEIN